MRATLTIQAGPHTGRCVELKSGKQFLIGRASFADMSITDDIGVSGRHCALIWDGGDTCLLRDLKSTNGTFVNDERVSEAVLTHFDRIKIGKTCFELQIVAEEQSSPLVQTRAGSERPDVSAPAQPPPATLRPERVIVEVREGPDAGKRLVLQPGTTSLVGRASWADLALSNDVEISGRHFALECTDVECRVRDMDSRNGTFVNGMRASEIAIRHGDKITAGQTIFTVSFESTGWLPASTLSEVALDAPAVPQPSPAPVPSEAPPRPGRPPTLFSLDTSGIAEAEAPSTEPPRTAVRPRTMSSFDLELPAPASQDPRVNLLQLLRQAPGPLYALLDAARNPRIVSLVRESRCEFQSLYEGAQGEVLANWAPYLVLLTPTAPFLETLVAEAWGNSWGVYLTCPQPFADVRKHLRHFLLVTLPDKRQVYFRFYDPRVLRVFLPTCQPEQLKEFFGPVTAYWMESTAVDTLLKFTTNGKRISKETIALWLNKTLQVEKLATFAAS